MRRARRRPRSDTSHTRSGSGPSGPGATIGSLNLTDPRGARDAGLRRVLRSDVDRRGRGAGERGRERRGECGHESRAAEDGHVCALVPRYWVVLRIVELPSRRLLFACICRFFPRNGLCNRQPRTLTQRLRPSHGAFRRLWNPFRPPVYSAAAHGRPEAENVEVQARQASRTARNLRSARAGLPDVSAAEAPAPRLPELQDPRADVEPLQLS